MACMVKGCCKSALGIANLADFGPATWISNSTPGARIPRNESSSTAKMWMPHKTSGSLVIEVSWGISWACQVSTELLYLPFQCPRAGTEHIYSNRPDLGDEPLGNPDSMGLLMAVASWRKGLARQDKPQWIWHTWQELMCCHLTLQLKRLNLLPWLEKTNRLIFIQIPNMFSLC